MLTQRVFHQVPDGHWWVAWIDHVSFTIQIDRVHVVLSPLPPALLTRWAADGAGLSDGPKSSLDALLDDRRRCEVIRVDVSTMPLFAVGDVFSNRRLLASPVDDSCVASICDLPEVGRTVRIDVDTTVFGFRPSGERYPRASGVQVTDLGRTASSDLLVSRYPMTSGTSRVLPLRIDTGRAFLPAAELMRSLVAPRPRLIRQLFGKSLAFALAEMVTSHDPSASPGRPFSMALGRGFVATDAPYLANLIAAYNPAGAEAAEHVFASLHQRKLATTSPPLQPSVRDSEPIPVRLPFGRGEMRIIARCLRLPGGDALICKVVGGSWPVGPPLEVTVEHDIVDPSRDPVPRPRRTTVPEDGVVGEPDEDEGYELVEQPGRDGKPVEVDVETVCWEGLPSVRVRHRDGERSPTTTVPGGGAPGLGISFGEPVSGGGHRQGNANHSASSLPERFAATLAMFDRLTAANLVSSHGDVVTGPGKSVVARMRFKTYGDVLVWSFQENDGRRWTQVSRKGGKGRLRLFVIRRVTLLDGLIVYWISIENSTSKHAAVLLTFGETNGGPGDIPAAEVGVGDLWGALDRLADQKGHVGDADGFAQVIPGRRASVTTYRHLLKARTLGGAPAVHEELDEAKAMEALNRLATARAPGDSRKTGPSTA